MHYASILKISVSITLYKNQVKRVKDLNVKTEKLKLPEKDIICYTL